MKKILIIQNIIPLYRKPLYNLLSEHYHVTVLHSGNATVTDSDLYEEVIKPYYKLTKFYFQKGVLEAIWSNNYEVIITMFDLGWFMNLFGVFVKRKSRYLFWGHRYSKNSIGNIVRNFFMKRCDGIILYSDCEKNRMILNGIDKSKIFIAHNTMLIGNSQNGSLNLVKNKILFVGRAQKRKKVDLLLKAFATIKDNIPSSITIDIVGDGGENLYLSELAASLNIENRVLFHGAITDEALLKPIFMESIAYVSPGAVGLSVLQSFSYGVPVITGRNNYHGPEFSNIYHDVNGFIYESIDDLEKVLTELCNNKNKAKKLGNNAYKYYTEKREMNVMLEGFQKAISNINE